MYIDVIKGIGIGLVYYMFAVAFSSREYWFQWKSIALFLLIGLVWIFTYRKHETHKKSIFLILGYTSLIAFSIPILGTLTEPFFLQRMVKDIFVFLPLVPFSIAISKLVRNKTIVCFNALLIFLLSLPIYCIIYYHITINGLLSKNTLVSVMKTNPNEAIEFFKAYVGIAGLTVSVISLGIVILMSWLMANKSFRIARDGKFGKTSSIFVVVVMLGLLVDAIPKSYVGRTIVGAIDIKNKMDNFNKNAQNRMSAMQSWHEPGLHGNDGDSFALVIGETHTRSHSQAYGYNRKNNPFLLESMASGESYLAKNAFSCAALTHVVMEFALTEKSQYNNLETEKAYNIVEMAKHAGYRVVWISNQQKDSLAGYIAEEADTVIWMNKNVQDTYLRQRQNLYDNNIVDYLRTAETSKQKTLYVIHLLGSHSNYSCRYPENFNKWGSYENYSDNVDNYDNSILYNDYVMENLRKVLFNKFDVAAMLYFADHGEEVSTAFRHGDDAFLANYKKNNKYCDIVKIAMYLSVNKNYADKYKNLTNGWRFNSDKFYTNDMVYDTMLGIMNIKCSNYDKTNDFASESYSHELKDLKTISGEVELKKCL